MNSLPEELLIKIFKHLIPDKSYNINEFKQYFLIYKNWYYILNTLTMKIYFAKLIGLYDILLIDHSFNSINKLLNYETITHYAGYKYVSSNYNSSLIDIFSVEGLINLPFCKFKKSLCIDNKCHMKKSPNCYYNHHNIQNYITHPIMRGMDNIGRNYLLFVYTDIEKNEIFYEFIYNKIIHNQLITTYSGIYNKTYIGMLSDNKIINEHFNREINYYSYIYITKLLDGDKCTIPKYNTITNQFYESRKGDIKLLWN